MLTLALELSTRRGSVALAGICSEFRLLDEEQWEAPQARSEQVFGAIMDLLARRGLAAADVEAFAVGRGPGGFSGIRMAVTAAQAFALPRARRVVAVSSGAALAEAARAAHPGRPVAVVGDARRGTWWWGLFGPGGEVRRDWAAETPEQARAGWPDDAVIVSPDWDRLAAAAGDDTRWDRRAWYPRAGDVARLAAIPLLHGEAAEPVEPIYLHAAV